MNITKYEHACVVLEEQGKKLVIDPGEFSTSFTPSADIVSVVVTHVHFDHFSLEILRQIKKFNPQVVIFSTQEVATQAREGMGMDVTVADPTQATIIGPFSLRFFGEQHAEIHPEYPRQQNVGVMVDDAFYYPGDSFTLPNMPVSLLALPVYAPWLKLSETIDFVRAVKPKSCFPTHNVFLSDAGHALVARMLAPVCKQAAVEFVPIKTGDRLTV